MWKRLKQEVDRLAIKAGAASLRSANPRPDQQREIAEIIQTESFFTPQAGKPEFRILAEPADFRLPLQFEFRSPVNTAVRENNFGRGWIARAGEDWRSRPLVLMVHGWNAELHYRYVLPRVAKRLVRKGLSAAAFELPFHSQRRPRSPAPIRNFISDDIPAMLHATRQAIGDMNAILRWARETQGCPAAAVWGFSLGGWLAGMHLCLSDAQDAAVLTTPVPNMAKAIETLQFCEPIRVALKCAPVDLSRLNLTRLNPMINPSRVLLHQADYDVFVSPEEYQELADGWAGIERRRDRQSHVTILVSRKSMQACANWLCSKLPQPNGLPVTDSPATPE